MGAVETIDPHPRPHSANSLVRGLSGLVAPISNDVLFPASRHAFDSRKALGRLLDDPRALDVECADNCRRQDFGNCHCCAIVCHLPHEVDDNRLVSKVP